MRENPRDGVKRGGGSGRAMRCAGEWVGGGGGFNPWWAGGLRTALTYETAENSIGQPRTICDSSGRGE
jgi:hypothetical protein